MKNAMPTLKDSSMKNMSPKNAGDPSRVLPPMNINGDSTRQMVGRAHSIGGRTA